MAEEQPWYEEIYDRAVEGARRTGPGLSRNEAVELVGMISEPLPSAVKQVLIEALGYAGNPSLRHVLEPFLSGPDPMFARTAMLVLCEHWGLSPDYVHILQQYLGGVPWDADGECQMWAVALAGNHLRFHQSDSLQQSLLDLTEDPGTSEELRFRVLHAFRHALDYPTVSDEEIISKIQQCLRGKESTATPEREL